MFFTCATRAPHADHGAAATVTRETKHLTVDIHCHYYVLESDALMGLPGERPPRRSDVNSGALTQAVNKERHKIDMPRLTDVELRLADMDRLGIDVQVLSPSPGHYNYSLPAELAREVAVLVNDRLAEIAAERPDRFAAMGTVPLQDPAMAVAEMERMTRKLGMRGVEISTNVNGKDLTRAGLEPFFARAEELGTLVFVHPAGTAYVDRMADHYFRNTIGHPLESTVALGHLVFDGYLERLPGLKVCIAHGGGYYASYPGRFDHAYEWRPDCRENARKRPSEYMKNVYFDSLVFTEAQLRALIDIWGADHIVLGSDYPFDMAEPDPVRRVLSVKGITEEQRKAVLGGNAARLLGLPHTRA